MRLLFMLISIGYLQVANAQLNSYVADGAAYIKHTVKKSESVYGIAKAYFIDLTELAKANGLDKNASLKEGMELRIPLAGHLKDNCSGDSCVPVMYTVQQSEGLYRIGKNHGGIKAAQLKALNHLNSEAVSVGTSLLVGYLVVSPHGITATDRTNTPEANPDTLAAKNNSQALPAEIKEEKIKESEPARIVKQPATKKTAGDSAMLTYKGNGFFEAAFKPGNNEKILTASNFKSESGWADGKFYVLVDGIEQGTILSIKNIGSGKMIYAKVIGALPQVKHSDNIKIRISSAGMIALGLLYDEPYDVQVSY